MPPGLVAAPPSRKRASLLYPAPSVRGVRPTTKKMAHRLHGAKRMSASEKDPKRQAMSTRGRAWLVRWRASRAQQ